VNFRILVSGSDLAGAQLVVTVVRFLERIHGRALSLPSALHARAGAAAVLDVWTSEPAPVKERRRSSAWPRRRAPRRLRSPSRGSSALSLQALLVVCALPLRALPGARRCSLRYVVIGRPLLSSSAPSPWPSYCPWCSDLIVQCERYCNKK
jgi:hypothetical protein